MPYLIEEDREILSHRNNSGGKQFIGKNWIVNVVICEKSNETKRKKMREKNKKKEAQYLCGSIY